MNHNPSSSDDLSAALHGIADEVGSISPVVADSDFSTNVRLHAKAVRRRRRAQHTGIAAASVAIIAVAGVVIAQNLPSGTQPITPAPPAPSESSPFPACGADVDSPDVDHGLTLVSEAHLDENGDPASSGDTPYATDIDIGTILPLQLLNSGADAVGIGMTGWASIVVVKDGVVVAQPGPTPEPWTDLDLAAGESTPVSASQPEICDGTQLPDGDYQAYALLDVQLGAAGTDGEDRSQITAYGGPWTITLGETPVPPETLSLQCGDQVSEIPRFTDPIRIEVTLPEDGVIDGDGQRMVRVDFRNSSDEQQHVTGDRIEAFVVSDGEVIASGATDADLDLEFEPDNAAGDGFFPQFPTTRCDNGELIAPGDYQFYVIVNFEDAQTGDLVEAIVGPEEVTVGELTDNPDGSQSTPASGTLPALDPAAQFPACGAAVPREDDSTFAMITPDPIESLPADEEVFSTEIEITNVTEDYLIGNSATWVPGVLVRDGRVVSGSGAGHDDAQDFGLAPGESFTLPLSVGLEICGTDTAEALPAGSYEVWGSTEFYLKERQLRTGESESTNDVVPSIIKLATATLG